VSFEDVLSPDVLTAVVGLFYVEEDHWSPVGRAGSV
jgi:hypothetical protein